VRFSGNSVKMPARLLLTWPALLAVSAAVRHFLIQYVGDVAVYVASHTVDRFAELRQRIKDSVYARAQAVYAAAGPQRYDAVLVVGHSLGSVVSYDILNRLLNEDQLQQAVGGPVLDVARRTRLLLTFGSPLDKTVFIFATQNRRMNEAREALATTLQPLIQDYAVRASLRWINIYSPWDIISGALNYYDEPGMTSPHAVQNLADTEATTLLAAHTEYWEDALLRSTLSQALTS
jgi:pimeloyl-ACP methyl ester carboxylesterase